MINKNHLHAVFVVLIAFAISACESTGPSQTTSVDRVLRATEHVNAPYKKILVVAAVPSRETARNIEFGITGELNSAKVEAHSFVRESSSTEPTEAAIQDFIKEHGIDAVIVVSANLTAAAVRQQSEEQIDIQVIPQGGSLVGFFRSDYKEVKRPNQAEGSDYTLDVSLVSDLYDVKSDKRVYSIESSTQNGETRYKIFMAQSKAIAGRLKEDGLIR